MEWIAVGKYRKPFAEGPATAVLHGTSMPGCSWGKETSLSFLHIRGTSKVFQTVLTDSSWSFVCEEEEVVSIAQAL